MKTEINNPINNKRQIINEIGEDGANAYELFLDQLTDANFHMLRQKIEKDFTSDILKRNKR